MRFILSRLFFEFGQQVFVCLLTSLNSWQSDNHSLDRLRSLLRRQECIHLYKMKVSTVHTDYMLKVTGMERHTHTCFCECHFFWDNLVRQESVALFKAAGNYVQQVLRVSFHLKEAGICKFEGRCCQEPCTQPQKYLSTSTWSSLICVSVLIDSTWFNIVPSNVIKRFCEKTTGSHVWPTGRSVSPGGRSTSSSCQATRGGVVSVV